MILKDFKLLVKFCRDLGITQYKSPEVEFTLSPEDPRQVKQEQKKAKEVEEQVRERINQMSEEDIILYSTTGNV